MRAVRLIAIGGAALLACAGGTALADGQSKVVGGTLVGTGEWPDMGAVLSGSTADTQECTGTLIAPTVVLTAGHCDTGTEGPLPMNVQLGTNDLRDPGDLVPIQGGIPYPDSTTTFDLAVLILARPAAETPRAIATGWASYDIVNGASVEVAGWGATDEDASTYPAVAHEAKITITDFNCSTSSGCQAGAMPDGELGAGGNGVDACPGDSGGPLYLLTDYGTFLAGTTSRSYANATTACGGGGIYERPDAVVSWIEQAAGVPVTHGPEPYAVPIVALSGGLGTTTIETNDPHAVGHTFSILTPPVFGMAAVDDNGDVRVCAFPDTTTNSDLVTVRVSDATNSARVVDLTIPLTVNMPTVAVPACNLTDFSDSGGGCAAAGGGGTPGMLMLVAGLATALRRRRML